LPWDQLALRAVTVGTNYQGLWRASLDHGVQFVLIGGVEIGQPTLRTWFLVHVFAVPCLAVLGAVAAVHRSHRAEAQRASSRPMSEIGAELTTPT
jgi:quinol-cytochrome oxidoreductase complex cytochrome b subunit